MKKAPCVQTRLVIRRVSRHPLIRSTARFQKHVVRGATFGVVPDVVNDLTFHHAKLDVSEIAHVLQDVTAVSTMNLVLAMLMLGLRSRKDL